MSEWLARLEGDETTLNLLREYLEETSYRLVKDKSAYYLKVANLPDDTEPALLQSIVSSTIGLLNGAAKLHLGHFDGVTSHVVIRIRDDGTKEGFGFLTARERSFNLTALSIPDKTLETWLSLGMSDHSVSRALTLYGALDHNWKNLYLVLDVIREDVGGEDQIIKKGFMGRKQLRAFKHTADSFRAIGSEARHALTKLDPPLSPMSLKEAQESIKIALRKWIQSKDGEFIGN